MRGKKWTEKEDKILIKTYMPGKYKAWEVSQKALLNEGYERKKRGIQSRALNLKITKKLSFKRSPQKSKKLPIGTIRPYWHGTKQYNRIKTAEGWKCYARYLLKNAGVQIPKGHIIWYKDRDSLNCTLENLEVIHKNERTSRNNIIWHKEQKEINKRGLIKNLLNGLKPKKIKRGFCPVTIWVK